MIWHTCLVILGTLLFWSTALYIASCGIFPEVEK